MKTTITALWRGDFKNGIGIFDTPNSFIDKTIFKYESNGSEINGTNPEELMAAAHAACYTMTLNHLLTSNGFLVEELNTSCTITARNFKITNSDLVLQARIPYMRDEDFEKYTLKAKEMCPVGNAYFLSISLKTKLLR